MVLGIDTSHYGVGNASPVPTPAAIDCAWSQGYRFWIVGLQVPAVYLPTIRALADDGRFRIEVYEYLYQATGPESQVRADLERLKAAGLLPHVKRFWVDYEHGAELPGDGEVAQIRHLIAVINSYGLAGGWYSGNWWTQSNISIAGIASLADIPYWIAYYVGGPHPITGQRVHTKQFQGTTTVCDTLNTDLNWRPEDIWAAEEGDDMSTPDQLLQAARAMNRAQLGELNNILQQGVVSIIGAPSPADEPTLYVPDTSQYHNAGDLTRGSLDHWLKDEVLTDDGGGGGALEDHTHEPGKVQK